MRAVGLPKVLHQAGLGQNHCGAAQRRSESDIGRAEPVREVQALSLRRKPQSREALRLGQPLSVVDEVRGFSDQAANVLRVEVVVVEAVSVQRFLTIGVSEA